MRYIVRVEDQSELDRVIGFTDPVRNLPWAKANQFKLDYGCPVIEVLLGGDSKTQCSLCRVFIRAGSEQNAFICVVKKIYGEGIGLLHRLVLCRTHFKQAEGKAY